jgi:hypothetical protein
VSDVRQVGGYPHVFALGDVTDMPEEKLAQTGTTLHWVALSLSLSLSLFRASCHVSHFSLALSLSLSVAR